MSKEEYRMKEEIKALQARLFTLQRALINAKRPVIVLIEGFGASGKGDIISELISEMDSRGYRVYTKLGDNEEDKRRPALAPFWEAIPKKGEISIFVHGWYELMFKSSLEGKKKRGLAKSINTFERQLADDGYIIYKFYLSTGKKEQSRRLKELSEDKSTAWRVTKSDYKCNKEYDKREAIVSKIIAKTDTSYAPWKWVDSTDEDIAIYNILSTMVVELEAILARKVSRKSVVDKQEIPLIKMPKLKKVLLDKVIEEVEYKALLKEEKKKLRELHGYLYQKKIPVVLGFEGWDAAGKGGAIRRLSWALDPRGFDIIPVAAPSANELAHHYLWRFWKHIPKKGHIAIFDRTWYGRVMVERIERFTSKKRCAEAYNEINEFEKELSDWGAIVMKFWIQIDNEEQLKRFNARQKTPAKRYKITEEDWRNREKWDVYEKAVDEMIKKTSTENAPWIIVEGNDKKYARIKVIRAVREAIEARIGSK